MVQRLAAAPAAERLLGVVLGQVRLVKGIMVVLAPNTIIKTELGVEALALLVPVLYLAWAL